MRLMFCYDEKEESVVLRDQLGNTRLFSEVHSGSRGEVSRVGTQDQTEDRLKNKLNLDEVHELPSYVHSLRFRRF